MALIIKPIVEGKTMLQQTPKELADTCEQIARASGWKVARKISESETPSHYVRCIQTSIPGETEAFLLRVSDHEKTHGGQTSIAMQVVSTPYSSTPFMALRGRHRVLDFEQWQLWLRATLSLEPAAFIVNRLSETSAEIRLKNLRTARAGKLVDACRIFAEWTGMRCETEYRDEIARGRFPSVLFKKL